MSFWNIGTCWIFPHQAKIAALEKMPSQSAVGASQLTARGWSWSVRVIGGSEMSGCFPPVVPWGCGTLADQNLAEMVAQEDWTFYTNSQQLLITLFGAGPYLL